MTPIPAVDSAIDRIYDRLDGSPDMRSFAERHGIASLNVLTILNPREARETVAKFRASIYRKRVVEIGAGVGYLALEMATMAKSVVAIESDPAWSWTFTKFLYRHKPRNLTWIFGQSETVNVEADVAVICSRSGLAEMIEEARRLAPTIVLISCAEAVVCQRDDKILDILAAHTKTRIAQLFAEAEDAVRHPEKRAAYEAVTGTPVNWSEIEREMALTSPSRMA